MIKSSSGINVSKTKFQKEVGISDRNDKSFDASLKGGNGTNDQELLRFFGDHSANPIN